MATLITNTFSAYHLTEQEALQGSIFTVTQLQVLQNQLAQVAEEKLALDFDTSDPASYAQQEAYMKGQMDLLLYIIDSSQAAADTLNNPESELE